MKTIRWKISLNSFYLLQILTVFNCSFHQARCHFFYYDGHEINNEDLIKVTKLSPEFATSDIHTKLQSYFMSYHIILCSFNAANDLRIIQQLVFFLYINYQFW